MTKRFGLNLQKIIELGEEGLTKEIGMGNRKNKKIVELCKFVVNIRAHREKSAPFCYWVKMLHEGKNVFSLGPKSDEAFLKCLGYLEHFPVDTLTARFFDRIGLLRYAAKKYDIVINPLGTQRYEKLRKLMMKVYLEAGDKVFKINNKDYKVRNNLGLIDILVWLHCNENKEYAEESVCKGRKPLCEKCNLNKLCEFHRERTCMKCDSEYMYLQARNASLDSDFLASYMFLDAHTHIFRMTTKSKTKSYKDILIRI